MIIPDGEILFRFAKPEAFPQDQKEIPPGIFNDPNLSCDWKKHREDPFTSFHIKQGRSVVIQITVCDEIRFPRNPKRQGQFLPNLNQEILHNPVTEVDDTVNGANKAHSLIKGRKKAPVISAIIDNSEIVNQ